MKYEDWIKYENIRQHRTARPDWITLSPEVDQDTAPESRPSGSEDNSRVWTMIVQIYNSRRI